MNNEKCPNCGASHYSQDSSFRTSMYFQPIWKDGVNVNPDRNITTTNFHCIECGKDWEVKK